ncbi:ABC transporter permease, partial [Acidisphaera sp. L21]|uniref:ABC transporter permease n=1 Tax=Acidisphaera sp. L21 TaxID=1641851 RepID=UPI00131EC652
MGLVRPLLARLLQAALVALAVATLCFVALQAMPGDQAVRVAVGRYGQGALTDATLAQIRHTTGLDRPVLAQYAAWIGDAATGRFGRSLVTDRPVMQDIAPRFRVTLLVGTLGVLVALMLAVPAGLAAGMAPGSGLDRRVASAAALLASVPSFVVGSLMVAVFAIRLHWLPVAGSDSPRSLVLPAVALACSLAPGLARIVRHGVAGAMAAPYSTFARMRGVASWRVALHVVARPALVPILSYAPVLAMQFLEGFIAIELLFNLDGIGLLLVRSLLAGDIPV